MRAALRILLSLILMIAPCSVWAQEAVDQAVPPAGDSLGVQVEDTPIPPGPEIYMGRRIAQTMHYAGAPWLIRESREREEDTKLLLDRLRVEKGTTICDVGCGNGFYSLPLAEMVGPSGMIIGVEIQQEMLDLLAERAEEAGIKNIRPVLGRLNDPKLEKASVDLALLVDVYHEFSHPEQMLAGLRRSLKPNGRLVLLEFRSEDPKVPIKRLHKMSKDQMIKELTANGFRLKEQFDGLPWQHMMTFVAEPDWRPATAPVEPAAEPDNPQGG